LYALVIAGACLVVELNDIARTNHIIAIDQNVGTGWHLEGQKLANVFGVTIGVGSHYRDLGAKPCIPQEWAGVSTFLEVITGFITMAYFEGVTLGQGHWTGAVSPTHVDGAQVQTGIGRDPNFQYTIRQTANF
jgi:hypothetical protein